MPARLSPLPADEFTAILGRLATEEPQRADLRAATRHLLALLVQRAPGRSVEVRVPPFFAVQCVPGSRHTRGTPPAVVETDALTWIALGTGELTWSEALAGARVRASGERSDLSPWLPLT